MGSRTLGPMSNLQMQVSDQTLKNYDLLREDSGLLDLPNTSLVMMTGEDRKGWLRSGYERSSAKSGASNAFCLCGVTGHMISVCEVWAASDRLLLTCPRATLEAVLKRVEQMVIPHGGRCGRGSFEVISAS